MISLNLKISLRYVYLVNGIEWLSRYTNLKFRVELVLIILIFTTAISPNTTFSTKALEMERHSSLLRDIVYSEIYTYEFFTRWLIEMKLIDVDDLQSTLENIQTLIDKKMALGIIDRVYNDGDAAILIGGVQLRMLKKYAGLEPLVNETDIANIIMAIAKNGNVSFNTINCSNVLSKFINYMIHPQNNELKESVCEWGINDLELYAKYILTLEGSYLNTTMVRGVIKYLYILRNAAINGSIDRRLLNSMLEDAATRYSIITAIFMKVFINNYNIDIVDHTPYDRGVGKHTSAVPIILDSRGGEANLTEALVKAMLVIERLKGEGISIRDVDIFKLIDILLNTRISEYHHIVSSIDEILNRIDDSVDDGQHPLTELNILRNYDNNIDIDEQMYYYIEFWYTYESAGMPPQHILTEISIDNNRASNLNNDLSIDRLSLAKLIEKDFVKEIIEYSNKPSVEMINMEALQPRPTLGTRYNTHITTSGREFHVLALITILIAVGVGSLILVSVRIRLILKQLVYIPSSFSRSSAIQYKVDSIRTRIFVEFWSIMRRLADELSLKIENSHTHREVSRKITAILSTDMMKTLLERVTYLYEILRYSSEGSDGLVEELREKLSMVAHLLDKRLNRYG